LAQDFEGVAVELGQFVEEEDAMVGEADLTGLGDGSTLKVVSRIILLWADTKFSETSRQ